MKCKQSCGDYACDSGCTQATNIKKSFKKLSDEEITQVFDKCYPNNGDGDVVTLVDFARAIEKEVVNKNAHNIKQDDEMSINMTINNNSVNKDD